ncbi:uncharacterized protein LOC129976527 [Argiope bruennichi]|uniref:uncharacterized protein LOC129976527 n=1 Tax=Argiope bruennichi TaxID=94029 RepID=UPI002495A6EE|nr:uncharacterized protein LOC129976527 [Argiope bruennichi]
MAIKRISVLLFDILICSLWMMLTVTGNDVDLNKHFEPPSDFPFLTPGTHTEPLSQGSITSPRSLTSKYITPGNTGSDIYDQIQPSRDPTTPLSRRYVYKILNKNPVPETSSTLATTLHAPPPFYQSF